VRVHLPLIAALLLLVAPPARADIPVVELKGEIHSVSAGYLIRAMDQADRDGAPLLIIRLDTPGGLVSSTRDIVDHILAARTPVAVFVGPSGAHAASAGFIIAVSADIVAMAPGTNMGAAHPVFSMGGGGDKDDVMAKKVANDLAAYIRSKAERRGRDVEMAEKGVLESRSFTETEAKKLRLNDYIVKDEEELVATLDGRTIKRFDGSETKLNLRGQRRVAVHMSRREALLATVASPNVIFLLLLGTLAGLGTEISHPGLIFPGIVGAVCLILFLFANSVIPVNGAGILLIVLAIGLFAAEVKVPSYGLLTVSGIVSMILGAMMLVDSPARELQVSLQAVVPAALAAALWATLVVGLVLKAQQTRVTTGTEGMVGATAVTETDLGPQGWVKIKGERWRAVADANVPAGHEVSVRSVEGLTLLVTKREQEG
jgi:membrane-bound serine protease (ClpP class)